MGTVYSVSPYEMRTRGRGARRIAFARQVSMYLAHVAGGLPQAEVGRLFARDRTTVAHACMVVEDRRDDPAFDQTMAILEFAMTANVKRALGSRGGLQ